jgi:hypothetical protein
MKLSKEQWAFARVYSFIDGGHTQDDDLRKNSRYSIMFEKARLMYGPFPRKPYDPSKPISPINMASGGEIPKKAMKSPRSPPRSPPRPAPRSVPGPPARPPPRPRTDGNPQGPEGKPDSSKNLNTEYAVGGTVHHGPVLRKPYNHRMIGMTSFEHGMIPKGMKYYNESINISGAGFNQGGYFPGAEHQVI